MKLSFLILCCIFITLQYEPVRGGLVKDFLGQVHDTAEHVRSDIRNALHINKKEENKKPDDVNKVSDETPAKETENKDEVKPKEDQNDNEDTSVKIPEKNDEEKSEEPVRNLEQNENKSEKKLKGDFSENIPIITSTAPAAVNDTQDGRENFGGACASGYVRTADGRCKMGF